MSRYTSATDADREAMLDAIGVSSIDELFSDIPEELRLGRPLEPQDPSRRFCASSPGWRRGRPTPTRSARGDVRPPRSRDRGRDRQPLGVPDAYTPSSPRSPRAGCRRCCSRRRCRTGLPVFNASLYEGPSAVASAAYLAIGATGRHRLITSRGLHPHSRESLATYSAARLRAGRGRPRPRGEHACRRDRRAHGGGLPAAAQLPRGGRGNRGPGRRSQAEWRAAGSCLRPDRAFSVLAAGRVGADLAVGEGQPLGNRLDYGGPRFGSFCATEEHLPRRCRARSPGRPPMSTAVAASCSPCRRATTSVSEKATNNIYLPVAERAGGGHPSKLARQARLRRARRGAGSANGLREGAPGGAGRAAAPRGARGARVRGPPGAGRRGACAAEESGPATSSAATSRSTRRGSAIALTERRSREDIDRLAEALAAAVASTPGTPRTAPRRGRRDKRPGGQGEGRERRGASAPISAPDAASPRDHDLRALGRGPPGGHPPGCDVPEVPLDELIPASCCARSPRSFPEVAEPEIVRRYNRVLAAELTRLLPAGSCTMKHNPSLNEKMAALPGFGARHHPTPEGDAQGALELIWRHSRGGAGGDHGLPAVSLQPAAGSQGELTGCW